jgi:hypothetical protein
MTFGERIDGLIDETLLIRKAHVIELYFAEAEVICFVREVRGVLPYGPLVWIEPRVALFVEPRLQIFFSLDREIEPFARQNRVFRNDDPRDRVDVVRDHRIEACSELRV